MDEPTPATTEEIVPGVTRADAEAMANAAQAVFTELRKFTKNELETMRMWARQRFGTLSRHGRLCDALLDVRNAMKP